MWVLRLEEIVQRGIEMGQISDRQKNEIIRTRFWRIFFKTKSCRMQLESTMVRLKNLEIENKSKVIRVLDFETFC